MLDKIKLHYRAWRYRYRLDRAEIKFILDNLQKGDVAVDIGAHKGGYLFWLRKKVGKSGRVYAFEPQAVLSVYLQTTFQQFNFGNVKIENKGVSSRKGQFDLYIPTTGKTNSSPGATLNTEKAAQENCRKVSIQTVTLDEYFQGKENAIALIKVDVEGHELEVFQGGKNVLTNMKPLLLFECEQRHNKNRNIEEVFSFLKDSGYEGYFFYKEKVNPLSSFSKAVHQKGSPDNNPDYSNNFLFIPNGKI